MTQDMVMSASYNLLPQSDSEKDREMKGEVAQSETEVIDREKQAQAQTGKKDSSILSKRMFALMTLSMSPAHSPHASPETSPVASPHFATRCGELPATEMLSLAMFPFNLDGDVEPLLRLSSLVFASTGELIGGRWEEMVDFLIDVLSEEVSFNRFSNVYNSIYIYLYACVFVRSFVAKQKS